MNKFVFNRVYAFLFVFALVFVGCDNADDGRYDYDKGYEAGWTALLNPTLEKQGV